MLAKPRSRRNARFWRTLQAIQSAKYCDSQILTRSDCEADGVSPAFKEGPSEEAATPEFPETRRSASLKTLPPVHPREPPVTASSAAVASRLNASHACTVSTLRECRINRNGKLELSCAEAVEDKDFLVEREGKRGGNSGDGFARMNTDQICLIEHRNISLSGHECRAQKTKGTAEAVPFIL